MTYLRQNKRQLFTANGNIFATIHGYKKLDIRPPFPPEGGYTVEYANGEYVGPYMYLKDAIDAANICYESESK